MMTMAMVMMTMNQRMDNITGFNEHVRYFGCVAGHRAVKWRIQGVGHKVNVSTFVQQLSYKFCTSHGTTWAQNPSVKLSKSPDTDSIAFTEVSTR